MRRLNAILSAAILALFLIHGILGAFQMLGIGSAVMHTLAWVMTALIGVHAVFGTIMTVQTIKAWRKSGTAYRRGNQLFWARRISGYAVFILIFFHVTAFGYYEGDAYRLQWFTAFKLATQILLVMAIAVHVITNVKPLLISFGVKSLKERVPDILAALSILIAIMTLAFIIYYIRWNII